ncbi:DMT family transporter [Salinarimonas soli]|uniref:DMT family transporter n=2 Tax=Salinarimonas soli TaxID=1638099 RepID=A0A5B2VQ50_9HYPH|nr:DMT family transporter [Salinarimonas soli]
MTGGIFLFSLNDAMGKWLVATYSVGQVLLLRSFAALVVLLVLLRGEGLGGFRRAPRPGLQVARVVLSTLEVACFYWAVAYMPLADVMTYYLAGPLYVAGLAALLLKERIDRVQMLCVGAGFVGVLVALDPSTATLTGPALVALAGSFSFALLMVTTRLLRGTGDTVLVTGQTLGALLLGLVLAPFAWVAPTGVDFLLLSLLGIVAMGAHMCVNRALKLAPASAVVPFQYTLIVWAVVLGYLVFSDVPTGRVVAGAAIIVAAGLALLWHERRAARA